MLLQLAARLVLGLLLPLQQLAAAGALARLRAHTLLGRLLLASRAAVVVSDRALFLLLVAVSSSYRCSSC